MCLFILEKHINEVFEGKSLQGVSLEKHMLIHTGESHVCNDCTTTFVDTYHLKQHKRIYNTEKLHGYDFILRSTITWQHT